MKPDIIGVMAAESALAQEDSRKLDEAMESLPDEQKMEARGLKAMLGDAANIPEGHPIRVAIEEARLRFEADEELKKEEKNFEAQHSDKEIKKAKKLDARKAERERRDRSEQNNGRIRSAAKMVNSSMAEAIDSLRRLSDNIEASREDFSKDRYAQMKLERLNRVVSATMRGIAESKINVGRVVENG